MTDPQPEDGYAADWYAEENATFGDRLAGAREAANLGQAELARRVGIKVKTLRGWENDVSEPRANRLSMLAGILNVSIVWLLTGEGDGLEAPSDGNALSSETHQLLTELRQMRVESQAMADRLGHLEKRLRVKLAEDAG